MRRMLYIFSIIVIAGISISCIRADTNQYFVFDENNVQQFEPVISIETNIGDISFHVSEKTQRKCTEEEKQNSDNVMDLFFEQLLRFNYALQKPAWEEVDSLSDELHETAYLQGKYIAIDEYIKEHGADLNVTSIKRTSSICFDSNDRTIIKSTGVLNYRLLAFDGVKPLVLNTLSFGDNPIAYVIYIEVFPNDELVSKVIGWSFKSYNSEQEDFYPEVLQ